MSFEDFQDSPHVCHFGYWNEITLAFLNLHVASMLIAKFQLKLTSSLAGDVV